MLNIFYQHKKTLINLFWRCTQIFSKQGISFLIFFLCSRLLVPYEFGVYNYSLAFVFFLMMFGDFGISTAASKYVAQYAATDAQKLRSILFNSGIIIFALTLILSLMVVVFGRSYFHENYRFVIYVLPVVFFSPMTSLYDGIYRGREKFKQLAIISLAVGVISVIIVYVFIHKFGLVGALFSQNIFYVLLLIGLGVFYRDFNLVYDKSLMKEIGRYSFIYGLAIVGNYLFIRFGILILGHFNYIEQISVYEIINKIFSILLLPFSLLGQVLAPNFSVLSANNDFNQIYSKSIKYTVYFSIAGFILGVIFYFALPIIFKVFFQTYSNKSYFHSVFVLCLVTYVANVWSATFDAGVVVPTGHAGLMSKIYVALGIFGALFSLISIKYIGFLAVIASFAICSLIMAISLRIMYFISLKKKLAGNSIR